jgi:pyridoxal phosphate enzyme (YggS family)
MSQIIKNIDRLLNSIPKAVHVVLATKYATIDDIGTISQSFPNVSFGENRVQHGEEKQNAFPAISNPWHFIGHLQRNKVKKVIHNYQLIHSVDSIRLLNEINEQSKKSNQTTSVLLQLNPIQEESKFGFNKEGLMAASDELLSYQNIDIKGLMTMAPFTDNMQLIKKTFKETRDVYDNMIKYGFNFNYLSMGMSNDYKIAIEEGSNMIRVGSVVFK